MTALVCTLQIFQGTCLNLVDYLEELEFMYLYDAGSSLTRSCRAAAQENDAACVPKFTAIASLQSSTIIIPV